MENRTIQTAEIKYEAPRPINIGDVFYRIVCAETKAVDLHTPCKVCLGTTKVTVNGVTFTCPCCAHEKNTITVRHWVVRRYRVSSICDSVNDSEWKAATNHKVVFEMYHKSGHGNPFYSNYDKKTIWPSDLQKYLNVSIDKINIHNIDKCIYDDYKLAILVADCLTSRELESVTAYNEEHGMAVKVEFREEHDKKSK